jgi:ATP-dependent Lon protease
MNRSERVQQLLLEGESGPDNAPVPAARLPAVRRLPDDALAIVPMRNVVLFPGTVAPLSVGRKISVLAAQYAARNNAPLGFLLQRDAKLDTPAPDDFYWVGTAGQLLRLAAGPDGVHHIMVRGAERIRVLEFLDGWPFLVARVTRIGEPEWNGATRTPAAEARFLQLKELSSEAIALLPHAPDELAGVVQGMESPTALADLVASLLDVGADEKQSLLETFALEPRLERVLAILSQRVEVLRLSKEIGEQTRKAFDERQREHVLREQLRQIHKELGDDSDTAEELEDLKTAIDNAGMPDETAAHARKELKRLQRMGDNSGESAMLRTWLEWMTELPWKVESQPAIDIPSARKVLDHDHYGLEKVKRRILEYLAVRKLAPQGKSPILCFVGPPGVGKTSLGQSIARATGRKFQRAALGGLHDEAEIRGHRRTYIGALPGNIIQAVRRAGSSSCVMMLDEIDKLGRGGFHGDPSSALLEVLDPEQNVRFRDNYLGVDFDLSRILFIATANQLETIPGPLLDRLEIIQIPGYTEEEKLEIARRYLVQRQREANGLKPEQAGLTDTALQTLIRDYTREAGVRNLEREIGAVLRHVAMAVAEGRAGTMTVGEDALHGILGARKFEHEAAERVAIPGVATGLAWTPVGGDILFIEATRVPGTGKLILTGQLGDVMKESAQAALTLVKKLQNDPLEKYDVHLHVPAGATPKDGPSAGVAMYLALVSLVTGKPVRSDTAMTGEISLRGMVLPIGGVKEKLLAALRAGIRTVMLPKRNAKDLEEVPAEARARLNIVLLERVEDAVGHAIATDSP